MGTHLWRCIKGILIMIVLHQYRRQRPVHKNINEISRVLHCFGKKSVFILSLRSPENAFIWFETHSQRQFKPINTIEIIGRTEFVRI